jgi:phosphoribosyl 1,2-cyclic phosphate phosphodiesterase
MPIARRMPTSILVIGKVNFLVDVGFDVMYKMGDLDVDFVLLTHWHPDHYAGLFRLRWSPEPVNLYAPKGGLADWIAAELKNLRLKYVAPYETFEHESVKITPVPLNHKIETMGYLVDDGEAKIAFLFDGKGLSSQDCDLIQDFGAHVALVDATEHPGTQNSYHNNVDEAVELGYKVAAERIVLTHIAHHNMSFVELTTYVKRFERVSLAHDGMVIQL